METKEKKTQVLVGVLALVGLLLVWTLATAGDLEPGGAPGSTMKTLDEVEPRIVIQASDLPLTITESGSYYLVGDVDFTSTTSHAIEVECDDVTIDLMGYTLTGPNTTNYQGIYMSGRTNVEIRNGTIRDFYSGIYGLGGRGCRATEIRAISNTQYGIILSGDSGIIKNCFATENAGFAMYVGYGSMETGNIAYNNGNVGFVAGAGSTVAGNTSYENTNQGISVGSSCTVTGNTCYDNSDYGISANTGSSTIVSNTCYGNGSGGIYAGNGCTVSNNTASSNSGNGINAGYGCTIKGNACHDNGDDGINANYGNTIVCNTARSNTNYGIYASGQCLVDQNTAYGNSTNMYTGPGCVTGDNCAP